MLGLVLRMESATFHEILARTMSKENVEAFKRRLEAGNRGDVDTLLDELHPEIEWHSALHALMGGQQTVFQGHDGVRTMIGALTRAPPKFTSRCRSSGTWETGSSRSAARAHAAQPAAISIRAYLDRD